MTTQAPPSALLPLNPEQLARLQAATTDFTPAQLAWVSGYFWGVLNQQPGANAAAPAPVAEMPGITLISASQTAPIPRTLHMSLVGARDMSIIETPPEERYPVQTYVVENNDTIIRDAIKRELKRGGQVYFVYNRVETIDKMSNYLANMLPDAKIQVGHGQMAEELLEQVMLDFYEGQDDILVATSIIENGLDVPNANTIIIYDADRFGISQLYQMRTKVTCCDENERLD